MEIEWKQGIEISNSGFRFGKEKKIENRIHKAFRFLKKYSGT